MRILMVSGNAPPVIDGVGDATAQLVAELARQRPQWRWQWLCRRPRWFHAPLVPGDVPRLRPLYGWGTTGRWAATALVRALRPDLIHIQDQIHSFFETDAAVRLAQAGRRVGARVVTTLHEYHVELPSVRHTNELVHLSDYVIANDPRNAERCRAETGREPDAVWWSGSTVPGPEAPPPTPPRPVPGRITTFGFVSALKALEPVARAIERLRPEFPHVHWRIVGPFQPRTDPRHAALQQSIGSAGVEFTGAVSVARLRTLLAETQVMVLPFADGASERRTSLHAAWAFGLPVLTTPPPTTRTSIADGVNCRLVDPPTPDAWAAALRTILLDEALATRLRAGSLAIADRYSWPRLAAHHLDVYDRLLRR